MTIRKESHTMAKQKSLLKTKMIAQTKTHYFLKTVLMIFVMLFAVGHIVFQTIAKVLETLHDITKSYYMSL